MKKLFSLYIIIVICTEFFLGTLFKSDSISQVIYNPKVDSLINNVSLLSISKFSKELSGDTITTIGGYPYLIISRFWNSPVHLKAAQYIKEKFINYGLNARYQINNTNCVNVIATKFGTLYPNKQYIICAHYDDIITATTVPDTVPGADDNASGVSVVLEAARLIATLNSPYTVVFIAFDKEETNGSGSVGYVDSAFSKGDSIMGVLNLDMIAYDNNNDNKFIITTDSNSLKLTNDLINLLQIYQLDFPYERHILGFGGDHSSFWEKQFKAIAIFEDVYGEFNPFYHIKFDLVSIFNPTYFLNNAKIAIGLIANWGTGYFTNFDHTPIKSSFDTTEKIATVFINYPFAIGNGTNAPRLYYRIWNNSYNFINPFSFSNNTYKFKIPGQPYGSKIYYYIAFQDSNGSSAYTLPTGGSGINPPGTNAPPQQLSYYIYSKNFFNSNNIPKPITSSLTKDTIHIQQTSIVQDLNLTLNLNHSNVGDLLISVAKLSGGTSTLSQYNGQGGQNFTNTIFDDSASISITQGTPPFTGRFIPITQLSTFNIENILPTNFSLEQNYPNPFNSSTKIRFSISNSAYTSLKVYDILGKEIVILLNEYLSQGTYESILNSDNTSSGIYFYKLSSQNDIITKKMLLIK